MAGGKIAHQMRDGALPGKDLRTGHESSVSLEPGFGSPTDFSRARGEPGGREKRHLTAAGRASASDSPQRLI